ncbi:hypothetical protein TNCT_586831 [Trichonephila clavata]|uniref:Uncharacterized protein n=1 Tax=Trichonephila clavata TaxID=2740835 RepID=A0A8X6HQD0_TRICU|nr:hypothetical protein TNCT_586831 [Trichonephila clavata]
MSILFPYSGSKAITVSDNDFKRSCILEAQHTLLSIWMRNEAHIIFYLCLLCWYYIRLKSQRILISEFVSCEKNKCSVPGCSSSAQFDGECWRVLRSSDE